MSNTFISKELAEEYKKVQVLKDDILMSTVGSAANVVNSVVGQLGLVTPEFDGALLNQNVVNLSNNSNLVNNKFFLISLIIIGIESI